MTVKIRQLDTTEPGFDDKLLAVLAFEASEDEAIDRAAAGILADVVSIEVATHAVAALTAASGLVVVFRMTETHPR
mgnify:CR=1 FL=1